jgi:hypothetical protein
MVMLELEAMDLARVHTEVSAQYGVPLRIVSPAANQPGHPFSRRSRRSSPVVLPGESRRWIYNCCEQVWLYTGQRALLRDRRCETCNT